MRYISEALALLILCLMLYAAFYAFNELRNADPYREAESHLPIVKYDLASRG